MEPALHSKFKVDIWSNGLCSPINNKTIIGHHQLFINCDKLIEKYIVTQGWPVVCSTCWEEWSESMFCGMAHDTKARSHASVKNWSGTLQSKIHTICVSTNFKFSPWILSADIAIISLVKTTMHAIVTKLVRQKMLLLPNNSSESAHNLSLSSAIFSRNISRHCACITRCKRSFDGLCKVKAGKFQVWRC